MTHLSPYGAWKSPITSDLIVAGSIGLGDVWLDGDDVCWLEMRPAEKGRAVIVRRSPGGAASDVNPPPFYVRTLAHEYGGGAVVVAGGAAVFSNFADQRLYRAAPGQPPQPLTPESGLALRYADGVLDARRNRMICVREDHTAGGEAVNTIVSLKLDGADTGTVLASGRDFVSSPRLSPDGAQLAWLTWDHPNMPWDGTELWVADVDAAGGLRDARLVAGGREESIFQPAWSPDGVLHFVSDRTGWWNLYRWRDGRAEPLCPMEAEFGEPQWGFGMSTYAFESAARLVCAYSSDGLSSLASIDTRSLRLTPIDCPYTDIGQVRAAPGKVAFLGGSPTRFGCVALLDLASGKIEELRRSSDLAVDEGYLSVAQPVEFPTENGLTAHALFYAPRNRDFAAPAGEKPPLRVISHGGPTGATSSALRLGIQYWTSRGFAVLDVDYGGSTGYGRAYRNRLRGQWGVVDVDDCCNGARHLAAQGLVDGERLVIQGGSAGGYTTLAALTFRDVFKAGASHFGVSDLEALAVETHKFESRYLDNLVAPYPAGRDVYVARSPIHHADQLSCPVIFFQGLEDKVVPPNQAERMVEALRRKGVPVVYVPFAGEQHGFRQAANIKRALDAEFAFYARVFGFTPADPIDPPL